MIIDDSILEGYESADLYRYDDPSCNFPETCAYDDLPNMSVSGVLKASRYVDGKLIQRRQEMKEEFSPLYSLKRNTINLFGAIDDQMAELVIAQLQYLEDKGAEEIIMQINSPGGSVSAGLAIYDTMNFVKARIVTVGLGMAASMGAFLLSAGSKGYRRATANTEILIHQPLGGAQGQASDIIIAAKHIERTRENLNRILSGNTGKPLRVITKDTDRDYTMTARQALEYGIIDEVISAPNKARGETHV